MNLESEVGKVSSRVNRKLKSAREVLFNDKSPEAILEGLGWGSAIVGVSVFLIWSILQDRPAASSDIKDGQLLPTPASRLFDRGKYIAEANNCLANGKCSDMVRAAIWQATLQRGNRFKILLTTNAPRSIRLENDTRLFKMPVSEKQCDLINYSTAGVVKPVDELGNRVEVEVKVIAITGISNPATDEGKTFLLIDPTGFPRFDDHPVFIADPADPFVRDPLLCQ